MALLGIRGLSGGRLYLGREAQESFSKDRLSFFVFLFSVFSVISQLLLILISWSRLPPQVPIFYSRPWGEQILSSPFALLLLPGITLIFFVINYFVMLFSVKDNFFLSRVLIVFSFLLSLMTLYGTAKIIFLLT